MFVGINNFWTFVVGVILIILLPGANSLFVLTTAAKHGIREGYKAAFGVFVGDSVLMLLSSAGAASLLLATPTIFSAVKIVGGAYLAWIGFTLLRSAWRALRPKPTAATPAPAETENPVEQKTTRNPFVKGALICLLNPKSILFFVAFFVQFVDPGYDKPTLSFLVLAAVVQVVSMAYLSALIFAGTFLAETFRRRRRLSAAGTSVAGVAFLGFGLKLATATLG